MKTTKWKLVSVVEMDEDGIVSIKHLDPIQMMEEPEEEEGNGERE